jgi:hypothetical protein
MFMRISEIATSSDRRIDDECPAVAVARDRESRCDIVAQAGVHTAGRLYFQLLAPLQPSSNLINLSRAHVCWLALSSGDVAHDLAGVGVISPRSAFKTPAWVSCPANLLIWFIRSVVPLIDKTNRDTT